MKPKYRKGEKLEYRLENHVEYYIVNNVNEEYYIMTHIFKPMFQLVTKDHTQYRRYEIKQIDDHSKIYLSLISLLKRL